MGPTRNSRNYSKAATTIPKTAEERKKRYKTRKVVPAFDQLFLKGDENKHKTPCNAKRVKNAKSGEVFEDSLADFQLPPPTIRKPLAAKNVDNTSYGASSHSSCSSLNENDTFDKLIGNTRKVTGNNSNKGRTSRAPAFSSKPNISKSTSNSSISYNNSSELNAILYCSVLPQGALGERSLQNFSALFQNQKKVVKQHKQAVRNSSRQESASSPDMFDSMKHQSEGSSTVTSPCSSDPSSPAPQQRTRRTVKSKRLSRNIPGACSELVTENNKRKATRNTCHNTGPRASAIPANSIPQKRNSKKIAAKDLENDWSDGSDENKAPTQEESKNLGRRHIVRGKVSIQIVEENGNNHEDNYKMQNISPALHHGVMRLTVQTPEESLRLSIHNSRASHNSLSDVVTSTPANQTTVRRIPSDGTPWGIPMDPMLEDATLSPVQRDGCTQAAFERSSVFESPMTFRSKCRGSAASDSGMSPPYTTANEDPRTKTTNISNTEQRSSLGNEIRIENIPVFDPEARVSSQLKNSKISVEQRRSQSRKLRRSNKSERKSENLKQKRVTIKEDIIESQLPASVLNDDGEYLQENNLSSSIKMNRSLELMHVSLSEILQNYNGKRRRGTIAKKVTGHEDTSELIQLGVLGTRSSLRLESKLSRQSTSNSPFRATPSVKKQRRSRKQIQDISKFMESLSLSKTETSNLSIILNNCTKAFPVHSNLDPDLNNKSPVVKKQRRSKRISGNQKRINISTDQEISRIITRPTRKRSSKNKINISTDMEQSYSNNAYDTKNHASNAQTSSFLPTRKSLRKTSSRTEREITVDKENYNVSSISTKSRTNGSLEYMQSSLDGSSVLSTFTRQSRKRANKVVFTRHDTSVSDHSNMSMGDSFTSIKSVTEMPVIKENSNSLEAASLSNTLNETSDSNKSDKSSNKSIICEGSEDEVVDNGDVEEDNYEEPELSENELSDQNECTDDSVVLEMVGEVVTEDKIEENQVNNIYESDVSMEKGNVSLHVENQNSIVNPIQSSNFSGFVDKNSVYSNRNLSILENSKMNSQSNNDMSTDDPTEVIGKLKELDLDKEDASMLLIDNSYDKSVSMIEVENTSKLKPFPVLAVNEASHIESASMLELEDLCESLPFFIPGAKIPAKPGKGWRRSLSANLLASFNESISIENNDPIDSRRQTVHRISDTMVKESVASISRLPVQLENKFQRRTSMVSLASISRLSQRKSSYCCGARKSSTNVPSDPQAHVLQLCNQVEPLPLTDCFTQSRLSCCKKIGEGVYGEVFMSRPNPKSMEGSTVLKIMPIEGDFEINGERQKKFHEILSEIVISVELSNLRLASKTQNWCESYVNVLKCWCLEGQYLPELLDYWDNFHTEKGSENDRPDMFPTNQLYIVLEFGHGGIDLEGYVFNSAAQSLALFRQIVMSLAVAEQELEFEHRDLHWGNVLVAPTKGSTITFKVAGKDYTLNTQGVLGTIIDFTLSRMNAPHCVVYNNLGEDPDLFVAEGDYQFEIYRQMKITNNNEWESFNPYTNVLWLHYILDKMINECYYKNIKTKVHKTNLATLKQIKDRLLQYKSATDYIQNE